MSSKDHIREQLRLIPLEDEIIEEIITIGRLKKVRKNEVAIRSKEESGEVPFVLAGILRVVRFDESGREILLYFIGERETCAMSITCCIEQKPSDLNLIAEENSVMWMVPVSYMDRWVEKYLSFRKFIFRAYQNRFEEMLHALDSLAFLKLDERLMNYLLDRKQLIGSYELNLTHDQIAKDLNTSRVVISRLLKRLEKEGKVELHRNKIEIM